MRDWMITKPCPVNIGDLWSRYNKFYMVTGIEFRNRNYHITLTRVRKDLTSRGNRVKDYYVHLLKDNYKPASEVERLLFLQREPTDE